MIVSSERNAALLSLLECWIRELWQPASATGLTTVPTTVPPGTRMLSSMVTMGRGFSWICSVVLFSWVSKRVRAELVAEHHSLLVGLIDVIGLRDFMRAGSANAEVVLLDFPCIDGG